MFFLPVLPAGSGRFEVRTAVGKGEQSTYRLVDIEINGLALVICGLGAKIEHQVHSCMTPVEHCLAYFSWLRTRYIILCRTKTLVWKATRTKGVRGESIYSCASTAGDKGPLAREIANGFPHGGLVESTLNDRWCRSTRA